MSKQSIKRKLEQAFQKYLQIPRQTAAALVPDAVTEGKLYEAHVLSKVFARLAEDEAFNLTLVGGSKLRLKSSPGPINRAYPHVELRKGETCVAELWTDVEFLSLSHAALGNAPLSKGSYHELDIIVVEVGTTGRPSHDAVWLGIECKNTSYQKGLLKEILGIRRELSLFTDLNKTKFSLWPRASVRATPPSCLVVYATDSAVLDYAAPGSIFGIDFVHEEM